MYLRQYHMMAKTIPMLRSCNLPGQGLLLQVLVSSPRPTQSCPPWAGLGLVHVRARVCIPLPQDRVHPLQGFHPLHWPSTDNISNGKREWVIFRSKNRSESFAAKHIVVSLPNRTAGRKGRQNACASRTWQLLFTTLFTTTPLLFTILVSWRNRTAGRGRRQNAWAWQTRRGYYLRVLSEIHLTLMFLALLFKGMWSLVEGFSQTKLLLALASIFISCKFDFSKVQGVNKSCCCCCQSNLQTKTIRTFLKRYLGIFLYYKHGLLVPPLHTAFPHAMVWDHHMCESWSVSPPHRSYYTLSIYSSCSSHHPL